MSLALTPEAWLSVLQRTLGDIGCTDVHIRSFEINSQETEFAIEYIYNNFREIQTLIGATDSLEDFYTYDTLLNISNHIALRHGLQLVA